MPAQSGVREDLRGSDRLLLKPLVKRAELELRHRRGNRISPASGISSPHPSLSATKRKRRVSRSLYSEIKWRNFRGLLLLLQDFSVKVDSCDAGALSLLEPCENGAISSIRIHEGERGLAKADFPSVSFSM